jgi:hypothetical protein
MSSNVEIANAALTKLGESRIIALTDDTKQGRTVNSMFDRIRRAELRARNWVFSIKRAEVAAQAAAPLDYAYAYRPPADNLKILQVGDFYPGADLSDYVGADTAEYAYENGLILTDYTAPLKLRYVADITDPTVFDANFVEAFACKLAMEMAEPLSASTAKRQLAFEEYKYAIKTAVRANAIEKPPTKTADDTWLLARL